MLIPETTTEGSDGTVQTNLSLQLTSLLADYQWAVVGDVVEAAKQNVNIEKTDYGKELDLVAMQ